jgi:acyl-CoA synthetase (AMP-forming)/AMP-acid ligase II
VTPLDYEPTVADFIRTRVERHGDRTLIVHGERRLTYADADARSRELARGLMASGVGKGTRVGVLMPNGPDWVTTWLAASRIGALVVPINTFYKPRELGWVLRHADVATLLGVDRFLSNDYVSRLEDHAPILRTPRGPFLAIEPLPFLRHVWLQGGAPPAWADGSIDDLAAAGATINPGLVAEAERSVAPADPMILIYSSGSTADPKGAVHTHGATLRHAYQLNGFRDIRTDDRVYSPMPFFWVGGFVFVLLSAMHVGACLLTEEAFEPGETLAYLEREQATVVAGWPHYGKAMAAHPDFADRDLSSIRSGNIYDIVPVAMRPRDPELRPTALGMTETCGPHTIEDMERDLPEPLRGSFGRSAPGLEHKIVDPTDGSVVPAGTSGEICVRGYSVMQGLYKREREDTFDRDGFYHTGDSARFGEDGHLFFQGRLGDLIKTGGANVSPREVELVIEALDAVKEAYVVGITDPVRGQNVVAAVVLNAGRSLTEDGVKSALKEQLSAYKIPRHVVFCAGEDLPFTDTGKIDKRALAGELSARLSA